MADSIYTKIANIRKMVETLQKNKAGYGYKYVSEDEILAKVTAGLEKYKLDCYPKIVPGTTSVVPYTAKKNKILKDGSVLEDTINEIIVSSEINFEWVNLEDPSETLVVPWILVGQQSDASQAFGSGLTYCTRYFFLKFFKSATLESDPDQWRSKQKEAFDIENRVVAAEIIKTVDTICQSNVNDENRQGLADVIKGIVKVNGKASANYSKVEDPEIARRLLEEIKKYFGIE